MSRQFWFKRRRYGYGWIPVTWQGFAVLFGYVAAVIVASFAFLGDVPENEYRAEVGYYLIFVALLTVTLLRITHKKAPKAQWRWGKKESDNPEEDY